MNILTIFENSFKQKVLCFKNRYENICCNVGINYKRQKSHNMKKYFYTNGTDKFGPFTLEELKDKKITRKTNVWFQEIDDWTPAGEIKELKNLFSILPPPLKKEKKEFTKMLIKNNQTGLTESVMLSRWNEMVKHYGKEKFTVISYLDENGNEISNNSVLVEKKRPPKTYLTESILVTLFCCLPFGIVGIVYASRVESKFYAGDFDGAIRASKSASLWTTLSFWIGLSIGAIYLIVTITGAANVF